MGFWGVILGAVIVIVVELIRARVTLKAQREEMKETRAAKRKEEEETHRRDAARAALEIMKEAPIKDTERNKYTKHYGMLYRKLLEILRTPEK